MKILRIGDPHVKISNLEESQKLMDWALSIALANDIKYVEFEGDQFHTHAVKRIEVEHFWKVNLEKISNNGIKSILLVGNHDRIGAKENSNLHAMELFSSLPNVTIVDSPINLTFPNGMVISYVPYINDLNNFIKSANELYDQGSHELLIAHQTFTGAKYENGFYSNESVDPELIKHNQIISGHIHTSQAIGKCFYIGTPKWDTMSDANLNKGIWIHDHDETGKIIHSEFITSSSVAIPIYKLTINEGDPEPELVKNARNYLEFHGSSVWINTMKKKYKGKANIKALPTDRKLIISNKDSLYSLQDFLTNNFIPTNGISKDEIKQYLEQ
jgi:DNA repair exonuclease SbcCD nuclease subunit